MNIAEWKPEYAIGIERIDSQHQKLVRLLRTLQNAVEADEPESVLGNAIKELVDYTNTHFADEEKLMELIGYKNIDNHRTLHQDMVAQIRQILIDMKKGETLDPTRLISYLEDWLVDHIQKEDKKIGLELKSSLEKVTS
ncbi:MAG: bacteriohemerythrin [candidate division Zixibacteria bacterium]|nr:bacteriohemerythrin [candidate division Zixibacteria bacterium]